MACSSGCPTKDHESFGACMRSKSVRPTYVDHIKGFSYDKEKQWNRDLDAYADARAQGIQPSGTSREAVDRAVRLSDAAGVAWDAGAE